MIYLRVSWKQLLSVQICGCRKISFLLAFWESFEGCWHISMTEGPQIAGMILSWPLNLSLSIIWVLGHALTHRTQCVLPSTWPSSGFRVFLSIYWQRHVKANKKKKSLLFQSLHVPTPRWQMFEVVHSWGCVLHTVHMDWRHTVALQTKYIHLIYTKFKGVFVLIWRQGFSM